MLRTMRKALSFVLALTLLMSMAGISQIGASAASQSYMLGDVNRDGGVDVRDATEIQRYVAKVVELDEVQLYLADVDGNAGVDVRDATTIKRWVAKIIDATTAPKNAAGEIIGDMHTFGSDSATKTATLSAAEYTNGDEVWYAYTWTGADTKWVKMANDNTFTGLLDNVIFARINKTATAPSFDEGVLYNQTEDLTTVDGGTFTITSWHDGKNGNMSGTWTVPPTVAPTTEGPTTTVAPTTEGPTTTVAPTTEGPTTTVAPTTEAPTTTVAPVEGKTATLSAKDYTNGYRPLRQGTLCPYQQDSCNSFI